jgi:hypothetical protein
VTHSGTRAALVLLAAYVALTFAAYSAGESYVAAWLPVWRLEADWLMPAGLVRTGLELAAVDSQHLIVLRLATTVPHVLAGQPIPVGTGLRSTTLQAYALHHAVIVWALLGAWPVPSWRRRLALLALGVPCVLITTSLDIPFVLVGLAQELLLEKLAPNRLATDPLVLYYSFVHAGGRVGLAVAGALTVATVVSPLRGWRAGSRGTQPRREKLGDRPG